MDDWPELEDAINQRNLRWQQYEASLEAQRNVEKLRQENLERAALLERLAPWKRLEPQLYELARQWGPPVFGILQKFSAALWRLGPDSMDRLEVRFKLTSSGMFTPPELCWEARKGSQFGPGWFIVKMKVEENGVPIQFEVTVKDGQLLISEVGLEPLKAALIRAFDIGPYFDRDRKHAPEPGIPFDWEAGFLEFRPHE